MMWVFVKTETGVPPMTVFLSVSLATILNKDTKTQIPTPSHLFDMALASEKPNALVR